MQAQHTQPRWRLVDEVRVESVVDLLRHRARTQPEHAAYTFLDDEGRVEARLTFGELDQRARAVAARLRARVEPGARAVLLYPPGLEFLPGFFGCLYAGVIAAPAPLRRHGERLALMIADCGAALALTASATLERACGLLESGEIEWLCTDAVEDTEALGWRPPSLEPEALAYLQYTSGSTSQPKGVMVTHDNLLYTLADLDAAWGHDRDSVMVTWLPAFHDMGLIYGLLQATYNGFHCVQMSPEAFIRRPARWLEALTRYRGTHSAAPNFAYDLCARKISPTERAGLDLSAWRVALNAAEPVRLETLERFEATFGPVGLRPTALSPGYGLAEASLKVSALHAERRRAARSISAQALERHRVVEARADSPDARPIVACGATALLTRACVVDPVTRRAAAHDAIGEIWISGPGVARGYWRREAESEEVFRAQILDEEGMPGETPHLRTGDLGFIADGQIYVTGRRKDLIIIRGENHYPQDLEWTVERCHPALRPGGAAAFSVTREGQERVVVFAELRGEALSRARHLEIIEDVRAALHEDHQLPLDGLLLLEPRALPKTSSGKKQRARCREVFLEGAQVAVEAWRSPQLEALAPPPRTQRRPSAPPSARLERLLAWLRGYTESRLNAELADERRGLPPHIILDIGNQGLLGMQIPQHYGGLGLTHVEVARLLEQLGAIDQSLALLVALNNTLGVRPILRAAAPELREALLPRLAAGRELAAFALTEPAAGSNPKAIEGRALPISHGALQIHATKWWSGAAAWASTINTFVYEIGDDGAPLGVSAFSVPQGAPGLRQGPEALTMGMRGVIQNEIHFEGVEVEAARRLGRPGEGMEVALDALRAGRLAIGAMSLGGMRRCAQLMLRYAARRGVSTGLLLDNPLTQARLSEISAVIQLLERLIGVVTQRLDAGQEVPDEAYSVIKIVGSERFYQAADWLMQLLGGRGYIEGNFAPRLLRDARVLRIFEGPTEALTMHIGASLWGRVGPLMSFIHEALGSPEQAWWLRGVAQRLQALSAGHTSEEATRRVRWGQLQLGALAVTATLKATAEGLPEAPAARAWAEHEQAQRAEQTWAEAWRPAFTLDGVALTQAISTYAARVGDVEPRAAGVSRGLDPLLQRGAVLQLEAEPLELDRPASPLRPEVARHAEAVRGWLRRWLADEFDVPEGQIDPRRPFFEYGLDSVSVAALAGDLQGWFDLRVEVDQIWRHPTIEGFTRYIVGAASTPSRGGAQDRELAADIQLKPGLKPPHAPPEVLLLTGATGFLGRHLLHALLEGTEAEIRCLTRGADLSSAARRLQRVLEEAGLWRGRFEGRIVPVLGDLARPRLGLDDRAWATLAEEVDVIYHCGALVNFAYPYTALRATNVKGLEWILRLSVYRRLKPVHYTSTHSVAAQINLSPAEEMVEIERLFQRAIWDPARLQARFHDIGYVRSKWIADQLALIAIQRGLPVTIYRPASISGHSVTGRWSEADWLCRLLKGCVEMGVAPKQAAAISLVPVDFVCRAIAQLSRDPGARGRAFNLAALEGVGWTQIIARLRAAGYEIELIAPEEWQRRLAWEARAKGHPLHPLVPLLTGRAPAHVVLGAPPEARAQGWLAAATLRGLGLPRPWVSEALIDHYIDHLFGEAGHEAALEAPPPWPARRPDAQRAAQRSAVFEALSGGAEAITRRRLLERGAAALEAEGARLELAQREGSAAAIHGFWEALLEALGASGNEVSREGFDAGLDALAARMTREGRPPESLGRLSMWLLRVLDLDGVGEVPLEALEARLRAQGVALDARALTPRARLDLEALEERLIGFILGEG